MDKRRHADEWSDTARKKTMGSLLTTILPEGRDEVYGVTSLPRSSLFTLVLKSVRLYVLGNTDAGREFHSFAVRIKNVDLKRMKIARPCELSQRTTCPATLLSKVLPFIVKKLDTKSVYNLYYSCTILRNTIRKEDLVNECHFSQNSLATARSLNSIFFRDIHTHLRALNLSGVHDLTLQSLQTPLTRMYKLTDLDVSYTDVTMHDFLNIIKIRDTLKTISINFTFDETVPKLKVSDDKLFEYQQAFKTFDNVTFVACSTEGFHKELAVRVLQKANLNNLTYIFNENRKYLAGKRINWNNLEMVKMSEFEIYFYNTWVDTAKLPILKLMNFEKYEIIVFQVRKDRLIVYATPWLKDLICDKANIETEDLTEHTTFRGVRTWLPKLTTCLYTNNLHMAITFWDKERTVFDEKFTTKLVNMLKEHIHCGDRSDELDELPNNFKWYFVRQIRIQNPDMPNFILDHGKSFKLKDNNVRLKILLQCDYSYRLVEPMRNNCGFLKKLTHLSIYGKVKYDPMFFKNLFEHCDFLETLQIMDCVPADLDLHYIRESKSLRNLYIEGDKIDFTRMFKDLIECQSLENIHLLAKDTCIDDLPDPTDLFTKCGNLYNICICVCSVGMFLEVDLLTMYETYRDKLKKYGINIHISDLRNGSGYNPYTRIFDIYPLRHIES